jgi:DNA-binding winged helix-turn-helix (wHTH) protein
MREPGRVFTRTELCERVWEHAHEYDTKLVEVFIGRLRKKLGEPPLIHTIRHVGYTIGRPEGKIPVRRGTTRNGEVDCPSADLGCSGAPGAPKVPLAGV